MAAQVPSTATLAPPMARTLGQNVYRLRVMLLPRPGQEDFAKVAGIAPETLRQIEDSRDPAKPAKNTRLSTVERLAEGFRTYGLEMDAVALLTATPSKPTGQPRHLRSVPHTGEALSPRG